MKLEEIKKIEEAFRFGDLFGTNVGYNSNIKQKVPGKVVTQNYINNFIDDAYTALDSAIQGGLVDPKSTDPARPPRKPKPPKPPAPPAPPPTPEGKNYTVLNTIFESIIEARVGKPMSIANFLRNHWYPSYMKGVNYSSHQRRIDSILNNIQATYATDKGKSGFQTLGNLSAALSQTVGAASPSSRTAPEEPRTRPDTPPVDDAAIRDYILKAMEQLKSRSPTIHDEILNTLTKP